MADFETLKNSITDYFKNFDYKSYFKTLSNLATSPNQQWETIKSSNPSKFEILKSFVIPSVLIAIIVHIINKLFGGFVPLVSNLFSDLMLVATYFIHANIIFYIAKIKYFEAEVSQDSSYQITGYVLAFSSLFAAIINFISMFIGFFIYPILLFALGLYTLYIAYLGFEKLTSINLKIQYYISLFIALVITALILGKITVTFFPPTADVYIPNDVQEKLKELNLEEIQNTLQAIQK